MSFDRYKETIDLGDTVILYLTASAMYAIEVQPKIKNKKNEFVENIFQTTYGALKVTSLIGKKYGTKVSLSRGWAYVLHPTPELWTLTLPHRTQIIYTPDISTIIFQLEIKPGSTVVEAGTGSGSLSHSLIKTIQPGGHLYTFDFHAHRVALAQAEFENHGVSNLVTVNHRDVCNDGFGEELLQKADAVFLDLPKPWDAINFVGSTIKNSGGRFASFSPCIEQVQKTCEALTKNGFVELVTMECLCRELQVQTRTISVIDLELSKDQTNEGESSSQKSCRRYLTANPAQAIPGHTGYITAASLPPAWSRSVASTSSGGGDGNCEATPPKN